jgi:membrane protein YqaA with SNARE-associated domain
MFSIIALIAYINGYPTITWVSAVTEVLLWYYVFMHMTSKIKYYVIHNVRRIVRPKGDDMYDV